MDGSYGFLPCAQESVGCCLGSSMHFACSGLVLQETKYVSTGVISSTLVSINADLSSRPLTTLDKSLITSCTSLFALLASPLTGVLADAYGRKTVILSADVLFVVGALLQAWTSSVSGMIIGRSIVGAAVGSASFVVPLYISELSPGPIRGRLVTVSSLFITGGQVVAYVVGWLFSQRDGGWRWMVGLGAIPATIQMIMLLFLPETPRYLVKSGSRQMAYRVLSRVYGNNGTSQRIARAVLRAVEKEILEEEDAAGLRNIPNSNKPGIKARFARLQDNFAQLASVGANYRALMIACMLQGFQQLCGFVSYTCITQSSNGTASLTSSLELVDVFQRNHFSARRLFVANAHLALHRLNQFRLHSRGISLHRSGWP